MKTKLILLLSSVLIAGCTLSPNEVDQAIRLQEHQHMMIKALYDRESEIMVREIVSYKSTIERSQRAMAEMVNKLKFMEGEVNRLYVENAQLQVELNRYKQSEVIIRPRKLKVRTNESSTD